MGRFRPMNFSDAPITNNIFVFPCGICETYSPYHWSVEHALFLLAGWMGKFYAGICDHRGIDQPTRAVPGNGLVRHQRRHPTFITGYDNEKTISWHRPFQDSFPKDSAAIVCFCEALSSMLRLLSSGVLLCRFCVRSACENIQLHIFITTWPPPTPPRLMCQTPTHIFRQGLGHVGAKL